VVQSAGVLDATGGTPATPFTPAGAVLTLWHPDASWRRDPLLTVTAVLGAPTRSHTVYEHLELSVHPLGVHLHEALATAFWVRRGAPPGARALPRLLGTHVRRSACAAGRGGVMRMPDGPASLVRMGVFHTGLEWLGPQLFYHCGHSVRPRRQGLGAAAVSSPAAPARGARVPRPVRRPPSTRACSRARVRTRRALRGGRPPTRAAPAQDYFFPKEAPGRRAEAWVRSVEPRLARAAGRRGSAASLADADAPPDACRPTSPPQPEGRALSPPPLGAAAGSAGEPAIHASPAASLLL